MSTLRADLVELPQRTLSERQVRQVLRVGTQTMRVIRATVTPIERGRCRYYTLADLDTMIAAMRGTASAPPTPPNPRTPARPTLPGEGDRRAFMNAIDQL